MRSRQIVTALLLTALCSIGLGWVSPAQAATVEECQSSLSALRQDTVNAAASFTSAKDASGSVTKLDDAAAKLAEGKNLDAVAKLASYQATLAALATAPKPKVDAGTASSLTSRAQGVIDCITSLG